MTIRFDPPPCDRCGEPSILQIVTVAYEGPSPPDQFLCRVHAPQRGAEAAPEKGPATSI
jgi:hypothetical protein